MYEVGLGRRLSINENGREGKRKEAQRERDGMRSAGSVGAVDITSRVFRPTRRALLHADGVTLPSPSKDAPAAAPGESRKRNLTHFGVTRKHHEERPFFIGISRVLPFWSTGSRRCAALLFSSRSVPVNYNVVVTFYRCLFSTRL